MPVMNGSIASSRLPEWCCSLKQLATEGQVGSSMRPEVAAGRGPHSSLAPGLPLKPAAGVLVQNSDSRAQPRRSRPLLQPFPDYSVPVNAAPCRQKWIRGVPRSVGVLRKGLARAVVGAGFARVQLHGGDTVLVRSGKRHWGFLAPPIPPRGPDRRAGAAWWIWVERWRPTGEARGGSSRVDCLGIDRLGLHSAGDLLKLPFESWPGLDA